MNLNSFDRLRLLFSTLLKFVCIPFLLIFILSCSTLSPEHNASNGGSALQENSQLSEEIQSASQSPINLENESEMQNPNIVAPTKPHLPTTLSGSVLINDKIPIPLSHVKLVVFAAQNVNEILYEVTTSSGGRFNLETSLKTGDYTLKIESPQWEGFTSIFVDRFKNDNIVIFARKK